MWFGDQNAGQRCPPLLPAAVRAQQLLRSVDSHLGHHRIRTMQLVLAYGVDPVNFMIDYDGRQVGRWLYRQQYLFDNPDASLQDAESFLADARVFTLRAQVRF